MDGLSLSAVVCELAEIKGARVEKLQQPERDELLLSLHTAGGGRRLLISASPENCRMVLTDEKKASPAEAPAFLMLMRKYLTGARILDIEQPNGDRVVKIAFETYTEMRDVVPVTLICEIMGRCSNIILVDEEGLVIDSIRRVSPSVSSARLVLPRARYEYPPSKVKRSAKDADREAFLAALTSGTRAEAALSEAFYGLSPAVAKKLLASFGWPDCGAEHAAERLVRFYEELYCGRFRPCIVMNGADSVCTLPFLPGEGALYREYPTMSEAVNEFYRMRAARESVKRRTSAYERAIRNAMQKLERKLSIYAEAIMGEEEIERLRINGELLTANLYTLPQRASEVYVTDYYSDPPAPVRVELDARYSPADNAQRYFNKYRKAKLAREHAIEMRRAVTDELAYLDGLLYTLDNCDGEAELNELRAELTAGKYIKEEKPGKARRTAAQPKQPASRPYEFISRDGITVLVGKNNRQNDQLTLRTASADDTWLHAKEIHGSHVLIRHPWPVPDSTLYDAAMLAAYYSKARGSATVPVDHTLAKYVKKPSGANPGMVIYTHQRTVYVTPSEEHIRGLKKK